MALYLQHRLQSAKSYAVIKTASAAIAQMHTANQFPSPTLDVLPKLIRKAARRQLGDDVQNVKAPFEWSDLGAFVNRSCRQDQPRVRWIIALLTALMFAGFTRPAECQKLNWSDVELCGTHATLRLGRRKNKVYRESRVRISRVAGPCCPASLLQAWHIMRDGAYNPDRPVFPGFDGRAVQRGNERGCSLWDSHITSNQHRHYLAKWFAPSLRLTEAEFLTKFGLKSGHSDGATAAGAANIPFEVWGAHGGWQTREAQMRYMEVKLDQALSVSATVLATDPALQDPGSTSDEEGGAPPGGPQP